MVRHWCATGEIGEEEDRLDASRCRVVLYKSREVSGIAVYFFSLLDMAGSYSRFGVVGIVGSFMCQYRRS
jgi:hypothetical protein